MLEQQFALLMANFGLQASGDAPEIFWQPSSPQPPRTRTVYSVGEAINQSGQNAKLGASSHRDTSARRQINQ